MRILFIGDVVGKPGRQAVRRLLGTLKHEHGVDFTICNGENAAGGMGITREVADELFSYGIDIITMGNHIWDKKEIMDFIEEESRLVRPLNYPGDAPGRGWAVAPSGNGRRVAVLNLSGRVFSPAHLDCPFRLAEREVLRMREETPILVIDMHAEATSEKQAMGWFLDGKVSAVIGTHTHVQTADERILPGGTAYITDVGMTGPVDSVIGIKRELVLERFLTQRPVKFEVAKGNVQLSAVLVDVDEARGLSTGISRISIEG